MSVATEAGEYADKVLALIPSLIDKAIAERREHACWWELYRRRRSELARTRVAKRYWSWLAGISAAKCAANMTIATECALARARVRMEEPV